MYYYEKLDINKYNKESRSVSNYSISINLMNKLYIKDPLLLKEELWNHLENLVKTEYPNDFVFDVQLVLSNISCLNLLENLREEQHKARIISDEIGKEEVLMERLNQQHIRVKNASKDIKEYKENIKLVHPVRAFVTFTSIEAADYVKRHYNTCCKCCARKYKEFSYD